MKQRFFVSLSCAAVFLCAAAHSFPARAQAVPRVKAKLVSFDGQILTLQPVAAPLQSNAVVSAPAGKSGARPAGPDGKSDVPGDAPLTVSVLPDTRYVESRASLFGQLKAGDYAGAVVTESRNGRLKAQEVYVYDDALRGTGEGRFTEGGKLRINGAVSAVTFSGPQDTNDGSMVLHYRGAVVNSAGRGRTICEGRAAPPALMSALACADGATIEVPPGTPISALTIGDPGLLVPGAILTVALFRTPDGKQVTPGLVIEKSAPEKPMPEKNGTVEKPQSPQ